MSAPPSLLIIWHSRTGASEQMARAALAAAAQGSAMMAAEDVTAGDMLGAAAYLFVCPENLAVMSGLMKEMFDRLYYPLLGQIEGRAYATMIAAGSDGEGATRQIDRIAKGWRLKRVFAPMIVNFQAQDAASILAPKLVPDHHLQQCAELGLAMAEGVKLGIY
ncbi:flavodoxin family protein [Pontixanthobacter sp.]|uniref:flavodoxin family protein n=1 Tax=Pontixanthobacter sp. TaxID=2792078 RepID=UPI003C7B3697